MIDTLKGYVISWSETAVICKMILPDVDYPDATLELDRHVFGNTQLQSGLSFNLHMADDKVTPVITKCHMESHDTPEYREALKLIEEL